MPFILVTLVNHHPSNLPSRQETTRDAMKAPVAINSAMPASSWYKVANAAGWDQGSSSIHGEAGRYLFQ